MTPDLARAVWRTSSRSGGNGQCVEIALQPDVAAIRDSKNREGAMLVFAPDQFAAFVQTVKKSAEF